MRQKAVSVVYKKAGDNVFTSEFQGRRLHDIGLGKEQRVVPCTVRGLLHVGLRGAGNTRLADRPAVGRCVRDARGRVVDGRVYEGAVHKKSGDERQSEYSPIEHHWRLKGVKSVVVCECSDPGMQWGKQ